jgi:hypothetical protein
VSCQFQKFPISIVTRCVKLYLKGEGYHHKRRVSLVRELHVLSLFIVSRLYLPSSLDRSAGLAVVCVCVFFFLLWSDAAMSFADPFDSRLD